MGRGPALVLMHTIRTQLDYFHRFIPQLWDSFIVYALDLPSMSCSDIVPGAPLPGAASCVPQSSSSSPPFDLHDVTLAGEIARSYALLLSTSINLKGRVGRVVAFNSYD